MAQRDFQQVDVFSAQPFKGNPVAVVLGADGVSDADMRAFANWTNLSETTFLLKPTVAQADYRVRIFTPVAELPFAGHPTLGSCHAWLRAGGTPHGADILQECEAGLIRIRRSGNGLAFAAPPLLRADPLEPEILARIARGLRLAPDAILRGQWVDNGPGWAAVMLADHETLLSVEPDYAALGDIELGVVAPRKLGAVAPRDDDDAQFEVRAFMPSVAAEDPVTGSLNAGLAQWLIGAGLAPPAYTAAQGTALGRRGRVRVEQAGSDIWVGGATVTCIEGRVTV